MTDIYYTTVYHPVTMEPFEVPHAKAAELRLNEGWLASPVDPNAIPTVQESPASDPVVEAVEDIKARKS